MKPKILFIALLLLLTLGIYADEAVKFTAAASTTVIKDKPFQLVYTINTSAKELKIPELNYFEILAGPFESRSSSYQIINGKTTSSVSLSYTYTLLPQKTGTFTIPSASILVEGQKYTSNGLTIKVLPEDNTSSNKQSQGTQSSSSSAQSISSDNVFIRTSASKSTLYEQEAVLVTYKLYTLVDVVQCVNKKMPDFNGFLKQDIEQSQNKQFSYENFNGKNYGTVVLYQVLLYPQQSGEIKIDKATFEAIIRVQNKTAVRSIFDDFFESYSNVSKIIISPATTLNIKSLPLPKPISFNGTVGHFSMNSTISTEKIKANEAVTLKINISGNGNMKLIKNPEIKFPEGFELYDPKVNNNFKTTTSGINGSKIIEYMFIPRHDGNFEIPSVEFTYFDTQDKAYKSLRTPSYMLNVMKGEAGSANSTVVNNFVNKEDIKQLGKDIRFIVTADIQPIKESLPFFGSVLSWLLYIIPLLIALILYFIFRKQVQENTSIEFVKNKKANKVAIKRMKYAYKLLNAGNKDQFYEEVLKATWNYLSDKLSIPVSSLTKERVEVELLNYIIDKSIINEIVKILNTCEFARYAPNTGQQEMGNLYADTIQVISKLEGLIKR